MRYISAILVVIIGITCGCGAVPAVEQSMTAEPITVEMLMADALKCYTAGNYEEAILLYEEIIQIEPKNIEAKIELVRAYAHAGEAEKATEALRALDSTGADYTILYDDEIVEQYMDNTVDAGLQTNLLDNVQGSELYAEYFLGKSVQDVFDMGYTTELRPSPYFEGFYVGSSSNKDYKQVILGSDDGQMSFDGLNAVFSVRSSAEGFVPEDRINTVELFNDGKNEISISRDITWNTSREELLEITGGDVTTYEITAVLNYITDEKATYFVDWIRKDGLVITLWRTNATDKDIQKAVVFNQDSHEEYYMEIWDFNS